jgi:hypothetical protein
MYLSHSPQALSSTSARLDLSRMQLIGRLTADPETRTTRNGKDYAKYTIGTNDPSGPPLENGERPPQTSSFHTIFAFGDAAVERIMRLQKGCVLTRRACQGRNGKLILQICFLRTQVFVEADFKVQYNPAEGGEGGRTDYLVQHRSLNVLAKPKGPADSE